MGSGITFLAPTQRDAIVNREQNLVARPPTVSCAGNYLAHPLVDQVAKVGDPCWGVLGAVHY